ncbi:hypothetical protein [Nostoc sp. 'Peltigera malacea cyanobiont' DB3992]|uniref:hypothetical protein n=1 Tax=Nostoc sp. 'Peltigera malacea cyanobiont' DB3992 TaxID=1206980 RepID=UPI000C03C63A|nr:hypothetical protein [Nostoc sp. 'Peltigera malacea cyanobiont' DB3992]PHM11624.1 hypothetical protein CK516_01400 [Nostoc sp. 'Peltigera malacea cyanobiont' DB3992]
MYSLRQKLPILFYASVIISTVPINNVTAQSSNCLNYWINFKTGQEECIKFSSNGVVQLDNPVTEATTNTSSDLAGYTLITVTDNGDKIYSGNKAFKRYKDTGYGFTGARIRVLTLYKKPKSSANKKIDYYHVNCNSLMMTLESTFDFDSSGNIVSGTTFGMATATRYQSTAPSPKIVVQPETLGYEIHQFACRANVTK